MATARFEVLALFCLLSACVGDDPASRPTVSPDGGGGGGDAADPVVDATTPTTDGGDGDAGVGRFCASKTGVAFCSDFEGPGGLADGWLDPPHTAGGGIVELLTTPSRAARALIPAVAPPANAGTSGAHLASPEIALTNNRRVRIELSMRAADVTLPDDNTYRLLRYFELRVNGGSFGVFRRREGYFVSAVRLDPTPTNFETDPFTRVPSSSELSRIVLDVVLDADPAKGAVRVDVDGMQAAYKTGKTLGSGQTEPLVATLIAGATQSAGPTPALDVAYDDVVVTVSP